MIELRKGHWFAAIDPDCGARVLSLRYKNEPVLREPENTDELSSEPLLYGMPFLFPPNRVADGHFTFDGKDYRLPINEPARNNHIHGLFAGASFMVLGSGPDRVITHGVNCDPEMLKAVLNDMTEAAGVVVYCNCLGCQAVVEDVKATGVIFESKEGRKAVMAQIIVDCTGDGDIFATAGAGYESASLTTSRTANTSLVFRLGGVSYERYTKGLRETPSAREKLREAVRIAGYDMQIISSNRDDVVWIDSLIPRDCMTITGLTDTAFITTRTINPLIRYLRENFPGLEGAYLYDFASQVGTRGSRRLKGVERFTMDDIGKHIGREDIIAVLPTVSGLQAYPRMEMPYGVLVPEKLDGLLVAGRCFSSSEEANQEANWIPHCIALGQAAGTAAALAVKERIQPREVEPKSLRGMLREQGVYL